MEDKLNFEILGDMDVWSLTLIPKLKDLNIYNDPRLMT